MKFILKSLAFLVLISISGLSFLQSCESISLSNDMEVQTNQETFDLDLFEQNIQAGLGNQWIGYAYVINMNGNSVRSGTFGKWSQGVDGNVDANTSSALYAASVSKMITAVAMLKAMDEEGGGAVAMLNAPIENFLPPAWLSDPAISTRSFRQVLQHRSGIPASAGPDYTSLKNAVSVPPVNFNYAYSNANFGLMRILMHKIVTKTTLTGTDQEMDVISRSSFEQYVQDELFKPLGIEASLRPSKARYYRWGDQAATAGWDIGPRPERLGSGAWYLSPADLAKFVAYLNHTEQLLKKETRDILYTQFLGWSDGAAPVNGPTGTHGVYYAKGGSFCSSGADNNCAGQGVRTLVVTFPNKVELVIMANNRGNNVPLNTLAFTSFDNAWH